MSHLLSLTPYFTLKSFVSSKSSNLFSLFSSFVLLLHSPSLSRGGPGDTRSDPYLTFLVISLQFGGPGTRKSVFIYSVKNLWYFVERRV